MSVCVVTGCCPADDVVPGSESSSERDGVASYAQVDVQSDGERPQERTDA